MNNSKIIDVNGIKYQRIPIKTHVVMASDHAIDVATKYALPHLQQGDTLFMSERMVAITQGRSYPIKDIHPRWLATTLSKFVHKTPAGIGLGSPWTMELAIREAGTVRILLATIVSAITKSFGIKGVFYKVAGNAVNAIDGPCSYTLPPYNEYATLGPEHPNKTATTISNAIGYPVVIIDANDLGVDVLGISGINIDKNWAKKVFADNPLGQSTEQTPLGIVRKTNL